MSHIVITCTCRTIETDTLLGTCPVPGHGITPRDPVDPDALAAAGHEAVVHLYDAVTALMKARAAWVSRGLPADNSFPTSLDQLARNITYQSDRMRKWAAAADVVADARHGRG